MKKTNEKYMTTKEFSEKTGMSVKMIGKWLRSGRLEGIKEKRKWMIPESELNKINSKSEPGSNSKKNTQKISKQAEKTVPKKAEKTVSKKADSKKEKTEKSAKQFYTVKEFSEITFLTEFGVKQWVKKGDLAGKLDKSGQWLISKSNIDIVRKKNLLRPF